MSLDQEPEPPLVPQNVTPKDIDSLLAREMNQMSFQEREAIYEEIHSIDNLVKETPELIAKSRAELVEELDKISNKKAYDQAKSTNSEYIDSQEFQLMFLRAEYFNARKAAKRLVAFLEMKLFLFGPEVLTRDIYQTDMDEDDMAVVRTGVFQATNVRDRGGRVIVGNYHRLLKGRFYKRTENMVCKDSVVEEWPTKLFSL